MSDSDRQKKLRCKGWGEHEGDVKERNIPMKTVKDTLRPFDYTMIETKGFVVFCEKHYNEYMKEWKRVSSMDDAEIIKLRNLFHQWTV